MSLYAVNVGVPRSPLRVGHVTSEKCNGSEAGSYLMLTDSCITQLKAQGPSRTCRVKKKKKKHPKSGCNVTNSDKNLSI